MTDWILEGLLPLAVPIGNVKLLEGNPNVGDVDRVETSLREFGQRKPIVCVQEGEDADGKPTGTVIAGNTTLTAARNLEWERIAAVWTTDDAQTAKAFALMDNRAGRAGYDDPDDLQAFLVELFDTPMFAATGYDADDLVRAAADDEMPRVNKTGGVIDTTSRAAEAKPEIGNVGIENSYDERAEGYRTLQFRSIVLDYVLEDYEAVTAVANRARKELGVETTADLFEALLRRFDEEQGVTADA